MEKVTVPREFAIDFLACCTYYNFTPEEVEEAKVAARADIEAAIVCFASVARLIK